ncbi:response regulator [Marinomonas mediterranea]|uniref:Response regulator receiver n=1 Tax=Marinomonas mediterranea (strain ATCC 700492 / JCM 21426 / NBRC 103028 / MMB-1) TaxID=717774 RepID=F2K3D2_MARM1|nr:response regulator [Marinomonas mediterranea]ADZ91274.1 response regulator receiver [Marinomonas mediterranea MMB-1]WCN09245.1 tetratricopeptide repeat protein [Marinomonas mediterranea]WCN13327.1 tetratricopeptide repeat protein [Marinomonas mediterranea]WCN17395.1 tetratricopeptide repeat protein [Marinomonas mediterranea MMB-1]
MVDSSFLAGKNTQKSPYAKMRALVADEFENSRQSIRKMLVALGLEQVDVISTGKGVIDSCRSKKYDLILCDFRLGGSKNGQQVFEELRDSKLLKSDAIFVIISAETSRDVVMGIMESQPDEYLGKPFTQGVLEKRLQRLFNQTKALSKMKVFLANNDYEKLVPLCKEHVSEEGRYSPWCKKALIDAYLGLERWQELEVLCKSELEVRDYDWAWLGLAKLAIARKQWDEAIKHLEHVLKLFPQAIAGYDLLAECFKEKGKLPEAQKVLEDALSISPRIHKRQRDMAVVSMENGDVQSALKASQHTLKLAVNSIHENPDDYIRLADALTESVQSTDNASERKRFSNEALSTLGQVSKRYTADDKVRLRKTLAESRLYASQGNVVLRDKCLQNASEQMKENPSLGEPEVVLELGKSLYMAGQEDESQQLLSALIESDDAAPSLKQLASDFLDEPVSTTSRAKAKDLNKVALENYAKKDYLAAVEAFKEALEYSPRHPGLNLNLVQSLLRQMENVSKSKAIVHECIKALKRVEHISAGHKQHKRYEGLKNLVGQYEAKL